ncbi:Gluconate 2-dehydrogenase cytochrome c subunit [Paraburkholderia kururiensis]|uniref:c-type cytochrome n=1 Tax=Paraburkholderia kururiensis TaxID=984307 RepID=UPI0039A6A79A
MKRFNAMTVAAGTAISVASAVATAVTTVVTTAVATFTATVLFAPHAHAADNPATNAASDALVARGAYLAKVGDCVACHTAKGGKPFAGGLPMSLPMGTLYTTNITPDPETGIGGYTEEDFAHALREGVAKDGHNLYPAMPYASYAKISDDDTKALYAYFMHGVAPVRQANRVPQIPWPLGMRWPLKLWNAVFLEKGVYQAKGGQDVAWNRGAYLVQSLGHCGSCHTPRGALFQEKALDERGGLYLSGALLDNWYASNLTGEHNVGLGRWSEAELAQFLKTGANAHASAFGSMSDVINNSTQAMTDSDVGAIAHYLKSLAPAGGNGQPQYAYDAQATKVSLTRPAGDAGAKVYATYCMHCHGTDGRAFAPMLAPLAGNPNVLEKDASSLINVTLNGTPDLVIQGIPAPYPMPQFASVLTDRQIADALTFIRAGWNNHAPAVSADDVAKIRRGTQTAMH